MTEITKRRVTMSQPSGETATDYVRPDFLEAYVADARTRWANVEVSDEPDAGPAGYHGPTSIPAGLDHPDAGAFYASTEPGGGDGSSGPSGLIANFLAPAAPWLALQGLFLAVLLSVAGAIQTVTQRNTLVTAYIGAALYGALYSTAPGASAGTELTGGSPAYARKSLGWSAAASSASTATATFDVASGSSVQGAGVHTAVTAGTYLDGATVTTQSFASQGTYAATFTYTQS